MMVCVGDLASTSIVLWYIPTQFNTAVSNLLSYKENALSFDCPCQNRLLQENKRIKNGNRDESDQARVVLHTL